MQGQVDVTCRDKVNDQLESKSLFTFTTDLKKKGRLSKFKDLLN